MRRMSCTLKSRLRFKQLFVELGDSMGRRAAAQPNGAKGADRAKTPNTGLPPVPTSYFFARALLSFRRPSYEPCVRVAQLFASAIFSFTWN